MFFCPNQLGRPYRTRSHIMSENTPAIRSPQTPQLFGELASLVRLRLGLLGIFTGELVSPYSNTASPSSMARIQCQNLLEETHF